MPIKQVTSQSWLKYLMTLADFGYDEEREKDCINKAYRDFNRTLRFRKMPKDKRQQLREAASKIFLSSLHQLKNTTNVNQMKFDNWHKRTCSNIKQVYVCKRIMFSDSQAQKWINMALKYIYMMSNINEDSILQKEYGKLYSYSHIPLDRTIVDAFWMRYSIDHTDGVCWSKLSYNQYMKYQNTAREIAKEKKVAPLDVEFDFFMN